MSFTGWDAWHAAKTRGRWPNEEFVRFALGKWGDLPHHKRGSVSFLDIGCGRGAQTIFLHREGFSVMAFDESQSAIDGLADELRGTTRSFPLTAILKDTLENVEDNYTWDKAFDCVVDVCSLQHVDLATAIRTIEKARDKWLKPGGAFFSVWAAEGDEGHLHSDVPRPVAINAKIAHNLLFEGFGALSLRLKTIQADDRPMSQLWIIEAHK